MALLDEEYFVGSFSYKSKIAADKAVKEQAKIMKLEAQMDYNNPKIVYSVYTKIIERDILETMEGVSYLMHLQNYLYENEESLSGPVPAIPVAMLQKADLFLTDADMVEPSNEDSSKGNTIDTNSNNDLQEENNNQDSIDGEGTDKSTEAEMKTSMLPSERRKLERKEKMQDALTYKIIIGFLIAIIVAMMVIALRSNSPNILNYKYKIQDEYSEWEQELNEKEAELNAREKALNGDN